MRMQTRGMCTHQWLDGATRTVAAWSALHGTPPSARTPKLGPLPNVTPVVNELAAALAAAATVNELVVALAGEGACGARSGRGDGGGAIGPGSGRAT